MLEYNTCLYEALTRRMFVNWCCVLNRAFSYDELVDAIKHVHSKHPYLRCTIKEGPSFGEMSLIDNNNINPILFYKEMIVESKIIHSDFEKYVDSNANDSTFTSSVNYRAFCDKSSNKTVIMAFFCHSCVDANSSIRVATDLLEYLNVPFQPFPESRKFVSVQRELIADKQEDNHVVFGDQLEDVWIAPSRLHEDDPSISSYFRTENVLISDTEMSIILDCCHTNNCSFQCFLWLCMILCQMKLFKKQFPVQIRFGTPATTIGRAKFATPIDKEDLVVGAYTIFVQQALEDEDDFWSMCQKLNIEMKEKIAKKDQMLDFFSICRDKDFSKLPPASFNGCTLGVMDLKSHYNNFDIEKFYFLPSVTRVPGMGGLNLHAFTIPGLGCYINCTYCFPAFSPEDMKQYSTDLLRLFRKSCESKFTLRTLFELISVD